MAIELNSQQIHALYDIENWWNSSNDQIYELSGAAGCGKTTLIRYFIDHIGLDIEDVLFVAYQGKAAMQMSRNKLPAQTIHSAIYDYKKVPDLDNEGKLQLDENGNIKMIFKFIRKKSIAKNPKLIVIDEASMVNKDIALDLLKFEIPVIALGDLNQLPPVFGKPFFLNKPNTILTQVMRQSEKNPIVWLAQNVLQDKKIGYGVYGASQVIPKSDLTEFTLREADIVLTCTNNLRYEINNIYRENIYDIRRLEFPNEGEKIICRRNNWHRSIDNMYYMINGMTGTVDYVDPSTCNGKTIKIDFKPDFLKKKFKNVNIDYKALFSNPAKVKNESIDFKKDKFEFAYAITTWLSQGSEFGNVVFLYEDVSYDQSLIKKLKYTAITRAQNKITIVI